MRKQKRNNIGYSKILFIVSLLLFVAIIGRGVFLSLSPSVDGVNLEQLASSRTSATEILQASRGSIYSSDGDALAQNVTSYKLIAYLDPVRTTNDEKPQHVVDKIKTSQELAKILDISEEEILKYLSKADVYQTEFGSKGKELNELTKKKIEELNLPGIDFVESYKRYYPKGDFASYTIGYAKKIVEEDTDKIVGEMGIEKQYNTILEGSDGYVSYQKDLQGYKIADTPEYREESVAGKDIYLTIDSNVQFFIEQALSTAKEKYGYEWFDIVILDANTGAVLGSGANPSFDPNLRNMTNYLDQSISVPFEPGSTQKTFTYMAAMEHGLYNGSDTFKSGVYETTDKTQIGDWNRSGWGTISYDRGYAMSSNVGIINLINEGLSSSDLRKYYQKLGFGKKTGIELPDEASGSLKFQYETEIYNAGFGQGITTTPVQQAKALTSLTNDGILLEPYIVEKIIDPTTNEIILENERKEIERVASSSTVNKMLSLMDNTVNGIGNTGSGYRIDNGQLIGKTGTAQIANPNGSGYLSGERDIISSFSGVYPADDPQIIIYAAVAKPSNGSQKPISDAVKDIVENISKYYGNGDLEDKSIEIKEYTLPSFANEDSNEAKLKLNNAGMNVEIIGSGNKIISQYPAKGDIITNKDKVYLITNEESYEIPNLVGLSSKTAKNILTMIGVDSKIVGEGYVFEQSIKTGTKIKGNEVVTLTLKPKF